MAARKSDRTDPSVFRARTRDASDAENPSTALPRSFRFRHPPRMPPDLPFHSPPPAAGLEGCGRRASTQLPAFRFPPPAKTLSWSLVARNLEGLHGRLPVSNSSLPLERFSAGSREREAGSLFRIQLDDQLL